MHKEKGNGFFVGVVFSALIITTLSCSSLSSMLPAAGPTNTPSPFPSGWKLLLEDKFENDNNGWTYALIDDDWGNTTDAKVANGRLEFLLKTTNQGARNTVFSKKIENIKDCYISFDMEQMNPAMDAYFGIEFRSSSNGAYVFAIQQNIQSYSLTYSDSEWRPIIEMTPSSFINSDKPNKIGLLVEESNITIFINDQKIDSITDSHSNDSGSVGFTVGLYYGDQQTTIVYDNLVIFGPN